MLNVWINSLLAACAMGATVIPIQPGGTARPIDPRTLQRLDESRQDTGPLRTSLFLQPTDLRQPLGFEDVFRLPGGGRGGPDRLARISGGLTAVFPRSVYVNTKKGQVATVPAGTIYYIGALPAEAPTERPVVEASEAMRWDNRASGMVNTERVRGADSRVRESSQVVRATRPTDDARSSGMMTDEGYRRERLRVLLGQAAAVEQRSR